MSDENSNNNENEKTTSTSAPNPGDVLLTDFGVVVVTKACDDQRGNDDNNKDENGNSDGSLLFRARLGRTPGMSIASCSVAYLHIDSIVKSLPAAPGMITTMKRANDEEEQKVMVHCYNARENDFLVSLLQEETISSHSMSTITNNDLHDSSISDMDAAAVNENSVENINEKKPIDETELLRVKPEELRPAKCAKFYPLIDELMRRADKAATVTSEFVSDEQILKVVSKSSEMIDSAVSDGVTEASAALTKDKIDAVSDKIQSAIPEKEELNQIYTMLKDEDLTVLLQKGQERLRQLVSDEIPKATEIALQKSGITIDSDADLDAEGGAKKTKSLTRIAMAKSREKALGALDKLLTEYVDKDVGAIKQQIGDQFHEMFDSLSDAARSDRTLNKIFENISEKTSAWQEMTGRLLDTKAANLFLEGTQRLQHRAGRLLSEFSSDQLSFAKESGDRMTKAFTEGDVAVARLKSIQLGDAVRARLVKAIEARSGSEGGLDGIIAGALAPIMGGEEGEEKLQVMLANLQQSASTATKDAHETLIAMLSQRSKYRNIALLRIEQVMVDLESQLGEELSAEAIASLASGEGGTAALFEPIARRAAKEIEKQLNVAEESVTDDTMRAVLGHVRKILSGELTISTLVDEVANIMNNEEVVAAGENLITAGERVLDALEGAPQGNKVVGNVMGAVEKAGITKEVVMEHVGKLDMGVVLDTAESAVTDEKARRELISSATDTALDFLLRILPSMPVPPFDGVKDGLVYHLSNLSMEGFKVKKENIMVEIAGIRAGRKSEPKNSVLPTQSADSTDRNDSQLGRSGSELSASAGEPSDVDGSPDTETAGSETGMPVDDDSATSDDFASACSQVKATELLVIDVQNISADLNDAIWSFEQTYFPYLKGSGMADAKLSDGCIKLIFELRKRKIVHPESDADDTWEPVLCLHDRVCTIGKIDLKLQGEGKITWILNKLAGLFRGPLRDYVVRTVLNVLTNRSGWLLSRLNQILSSYWGVILRTAKLSMDDLVEISESDVLEDEPDIHANEVELVWREHLPLGMNLLLNDESGFVKVVDFPRGSQARNVATAKEYDPDDFKGATIIAVSGVPFEQNQQTELFEALKDPGRPKSILFRLTDSEESKRVQTLAEQAKARKEGKTSEASSKLFAGRSIKTVEITEEGKLGLNFCKTMDDYCLALSSFSKGGSSKLVAAAKSGEIAVNDLLSHINGKSVCGQNGAGRELALSMFQSEGAIRPLSLSFVKPYLSLHIFEKPENTVSDFPGGPNELVLEERLSSTGSSRIVLKDFEKTEGVAEIGNVFIGDYLVFMNGMPIGAGCLLIEDSVRPELEEVVAMLNDSKSYPMGLTFARPSKDTSRWFGGASGFDINTAETFCITANTPDQLGIEIGLGRDKDSIVVTNIFAVEGQFQNALTSGKSSYLGCAIESVDGQVVPSYATVSMVSQAMEKKWTANGRVELLLCDDEEREWVKNLSNESSESTPIK